MKKTPSRSALGGLLAILVIGASPLAHAADLSAEEISTVSKREKGLACTTTVKARREGVELVANAKYRIDSVEEARRLRAVRSYPQRDVQLGTVTIIESVLSLNFERRRPRAVFEVVFEVQGGARDSIKIREIGRGKSSESKNIPLSDGTTMFVDAEVACRYYRS